MLREKKGRGKKEGGKEIERKRKGQKKKEREELRWFEEGRKEAADWIILSCLQKTTTLSHRVGKHYKNNFIDCLLSTQFKKRLQWVVLAMNHGS